MKYLLLTSLCVFSTVQAEKTTETFLAQPAQQKQNKKKKKSLATMRQDYIEQCEAYAHAIVRELYTYGSVMSICPGNTKVAELMRTRSAQLHTAEQFFDSGSMQPYKDKVSDEVSWRLVQQYACVQEKLLSAITDLIEQEESSCFMTADKQKLQMYQDYLHSLQKESELLVKELQAIGNTARLKR